MFEIELPAQFEQEGTYYERSVEERALEKFRYDKYAEPAHIKASLLIGKFAESFFDNNIVKKQVMALVSGVKDLDQAIGEFKDVENELQNVVHKEFDYFEYSELDKSNERFMRKQQNTNALRDNIFAQLDENDLPKDNSQNDIQQEDLFANTNF